jgi:disease resistance protein RPM1
MADAGVMGVLAKLGELTEEEATTLLRVDAEIRALRQKLAYLQALVRGADRQRRGRASELLLLWLRETREVAFAGGSAIHSGDGSSSQDYHIYTEQACSHEVVM